MRRNRIPVLPLIAVAAVGFFAWYLYENLEFYEETDVREWSIEALRNPYLAAEMFMHESGIEVTDVDSLAQLDELDDVGTLFFSDANQVRDPRQLQQVLDWLELGGNVIYTADSLDHEDDLLLQEFEVEVDWRDRDYYDDEDDSEEEKKSLAETFREYNRQIEEGKSVEDIVSGSGGVDETITRIEFGDNIGTIDVDFFTNRVLYHLFLDDADSDTRHRPFSWSSSDYGVHMMQFEVGSGLLTIITDPSVWSSYRIFNHDHAYLLWLLSSANGEFAILRTVVTDSLWGLTLRHASELLIAIALIVALWIWHMGYRFGRLLPRDMSRTRALAEHFSSISHYLWHRRHAEYLIAPLRQRVLRRATLTLGEFARADQARQMELLAERADVSVDSVRRVFDAGDFNESSFVTTVRLLKRIEQAL